MLMGSRMKQPCRCTSLVDSLSQNCTGATCEVCVTAVRCGDGMTTNSQCASSEGGCSDAGSRCDTYSSENCRTVFELDSTSRCRNSSTARNSSSESHRLTKDRWVDR